MGKSCSGLIEQQVTSISATDTCSVPYKNFVVGKYVVLFYYQQMEGANFRNNLTIHYFPLSTREKASV